jgi:hypothetical protein
VAIGKAIEEELKATERRGRPKADTGQAELIEPENVENFPHLEGQKSRDIAAKQAGFGNETTYRQAKTVVEHAEPELVGRWIAPPEPSPGPGKLSAREAVQRREGKQGIRGRNRRGKQRDQNEPSAKTADKLAVEYKVSPATRAHRHRHLPSDRARGLGKLGSWSATTAPSCYRKTQVAPLGRGKLGVPGEISLRKLAESESTNGLVAGPGRQTRKSRPHSGCPSSSTDPRPALFFAGES